MDVDDIKYKKEIIIAISFLIAGLILGFILFSEGSLTVKDKSNYKEVDVLNKEINNCIDKLNICEIELNTFTDNSYE